MPYQCRRFVYRHMVVISVYLEVWVQIECEGLLQHEGGWSSSVLSFLAGGNLFPGRVPEPEVEVYCVISSIEIVLTICMRILKWEDKQDGRIWLRPSEVDNQISLVEIGRSGLGHLLMEYCHGKNGCCCGMDGFDRMTSPQLHNFVQPLIRGESWGLTHKELCLLCECSQLQSWPSILPWYLLGHLVGRHELGGVVRLPTLANLTAGKDSGGGGKVLSMVELGLQGKRVEVNP
ncbi:hypothetical protein Tco_1281904 [Tanacetum coccineum]